MKRRGLISALIYVSILALGSDMAHVVTPKLIASRGWPDYMFGILFACMSCSTLIFSPVWGKVADSRGRKLPLIIGPVIYGIGQLGFVCFANPVLVCLARFFSGIGTAAMFSTVYTNVSDWCDEHNSTVILSLAMSLYALLSNVGYLLGGLVGNEIINKTFYLQMFIMFFLSIYGMLFLVDCSKYVEKKSITLNHLIDLDGYGRILAGPAMILFIVYFLEVFSWKSYSSSISYFLSSFLDLSPLMIGIYMTAVGLIGLVLNMTILRYFTMRLNKLTMVLTNVCICIGFMVFALVFRKYVNYSLLLMVMFAASRVAVPPLITSLVLLKAGEKDHGVYLGVLNTMEGIAGVTGSLVAGFIFSINAILPFIASLLALFVFVLIIFKLRRKEEGKYVNKTY